MNAFFYLFLLQATIYAVIALLELDFDRDGPVIGALWMLNRAWFALAVIAIPGWFAFRFGVITCPCCGERFAGHMPLMPWLVKPVCQFCGYNPATITRRGDF